MNTPSILLKTPLLASCFEWAEVGPCVVRAESDSSLVWIRAGSGQYLVSGKPRPLQEGSCLFVPPGTETTMLSSQERPFRAIVLQIVSLFLDGLDPGLLSERDIPFAFPVLRDRYRFERILDDLMYEWHNPQYGQAQFISSLLQAMLIHLVRELRDRNDYAPPAPATGVEISDQPATEDLSSAQNVKAYIEKNFQLELSLNDLANYVYVSPYHLSRVFKEEIGMSPIQYLIKCRIDEAKRLLVTTDLSVREIAMQVGYANANYFNLLFSKMTGDSPGKYRKQNR